VVIASDPSDEHFTIAVRDHGGGIDENEDQIFKYMFTGKRSIKKIKMILFYFIRGWSKTGRRRRTN
jgi:signal transduction histidine kinase